VQTKTAHHDPWIPRCLAPQVALTRPRLLRFALHFAILSLNIKLNLTLGPNKGVEEDREDPVLDINTARSCTLSRLRAAGSSRTKRKRTAFS